MRMTTIRGLAGAALATSSLVIACDLGNDFSFVRPGFPGARGAAVDAGSVREPPDPCDVAEGERCSFSKTDVCETKEHANPACNESLHCDNDRWRRRPAERSTCAIDCPSQYVDDLPDACAAPNAGTLMCEYPEGTCGCAPIHPLDADAGDGGDESDAGEHGEGTPDGGDVDAGPTLYEWTCVPAARGCPRTRPRAGSACVRPMTCDYGACLFEDGVAMDCDGGTWQPQPRCER